MRPASGTLLRSLRGSHRMVARARVVPPGQTGVDPDGTEIPIIDGNVKHDASADTRATLDLTTDGAYWPRSADDPVTPYGNEVFIERGLVFGNGTREWISQGYFRIDDVEQTEAPRGTVRLSASDRMTGIRDARLLSPIQFAQGASVGDTFRYLVNQVYPSAVVEFDFDEDNTTFGSHVAEEKRYEFLLDIATALGKVMYWDYRGILQVRSAPDPAQPVWTVNAGNDGVLVALSRSITRDGVYNAVVATGETPGQDQAVRAVAWDDNPRSVTYWYGDYGRVPRFYSSPFVKTHQQARDAASSMLARVIGLPYSVDFTAVPNPALEPLDPVRLLLGDRNEVHVLEKLTMPLLPDDGMEAETREQTSVNIGVQ